MSSQPCLAVRVQAELPPVSAPTRSFALNLRGLSAVIGLRLHPAKSASRAPTQTRGVRPLRLDARLRLPLHPPRQPPLLRVAGAVGKVFEKIDETDDWISLRYDEQQFLVSPELFKELYQKPPFSFGDR